MCLLLRKKEKRKNNEIAGLLPKHPQQLGPGQANTGRQELNLGFLPRGQGLKHVGHHLLLPRLHNTGSEVEQGLELKDCDTGREHSKWHFNH